MAGKPGTEIRALLEAGEAPGAPAYSLPLRTVQEHAARAKREASPLPDTIESISALERHTIREGQEIVRRLLEQERRKPTVHGAKAIRSWLETLAAIRATREPASRRPNTRQAAQAKGAAAQATAPASLMARLTSELAHEKGAPQGAPSHEPASVD